jgi:hypothetical protein
MGILLATWIEIGFMKGEVGNYAASNLHMP